MATVVNQGDSGAGVAGWAMALVVLAVVIVGAIFLFGRGGGGAPAAPGASVDVSLPAGGGQ